MSDKRKADITILLKKEGNKKSNKLEFFKANKFGEPDKLNKVGQRYRLRVNGRWYPKLERKIYYKSELRDLFFRSLGL